MEESGGEPDVALIEEPDVVVFVDCTAQSPSGRRSLCYDREAWQARKEARPVSNALDLAASMGIEMLPGALITLFLGSTFSAQVPLPAAQEASFAGKVARRVGRDAIGRLPIGSLGPLRRS